MLAIVFLLIFGPSLVIGLLGNRARRPAYLTFSNEGVLAEYRSGRTRYLLWDNIASVRLGRFRSDMYADIRYVDGREEDKAHIYGEAALELKKRFDARRDAARC